MFVCLILLQGIRSLSNKLTLGGFITIHLLASFAVKYEVFSCQGDYGKRLCMSNIIEDRDVTEGAAQVNLFGDSKICQDEYCLIKEFSVSHLVSFLAVQDLIELIQVKQCPFELMLKSLRWLSIHGVSKERSEVEPSQKEMKQLSG